MTTSRTRAIGVESLPGGKRLLVGAVGAAFWGWLLARWFYDWVVNPGVGPSSREPFLPTGPFESAAGRLQEVAASAGALSGPLEWLAGGLEFVAFGTTVLPQLAAGAWLTVVLTVLAMLLGFVVAVPLSVARVYGGPLLRWLSLGYTELVRGTPLLAQLFVLYYGLPTARLVRELPAVGVDPIPRAAVWVAVLGFTINSAAYQAEYIRGALESVDEGQLTAARALGLSKVEGIRHVVLPQTLRYAIPAWTNELVYLIKYSSLAAFIAVPELYYRASRIASRTFEYTPIFAFLAIVYLGLVLTATSLMDGVERRVAIPGLGRVEGRKQGQTE